MILATIRPQELRSASRSLRVTQDRLTALGGAVAACRPASDTWTGAASAVHGVRLSELAHSIRACPEPLGRIAAAVDHLATHAEAAQREQHRLRSRTAELERERDLLGASVTDPSDPSAGSLRAMALRRVEEELARLGAELARLEDETEVARRMLAAALEDGTPLPLPAELAALAQLASSVSGVVGGLRQIQRGVAVLALSVRHARSVGLGARLLLTARIAEHVRFLQRVPWWARRLGLGAMATPLVVVPTAVRDVVTGDGHDGWRGAATRVGGVLGIAGSVALAAPVPVPHVKAAGAIAVGAYAAWKGGSWVYDNRELVARLGGMAWETAKRRAAELAEWMRPTPLLPWGPLGPLPPLLGDGAAWDGLRDLLPRLPEDWRDLLPGGREPAPLKDLPLGPVIRLPILPGPLGPGTRLPFDPIGWLR